MGELVQRLLARAGISRITGHDLRRTFATLVRSSGADEFPTMRLLGDKIPGVGNRYISFPQEKLSAALREYSPLSLVEDATGTGGDKTGEESVLPVHVSALTGRGCNKKASPEAKNVIGGGGGESNSPSKKDCPEFTTSLVS